MKPNNTQRDPSPILLRERSILEVGGDRHTEEEGEVLYSTVNTIWHII